MYINTCVICCKKFESRYKRTLLCHTPHEKECEECGKMFYVTSDTRNKRFCSLTCSGAYRKRTGLSKEISSKARKSIEERYGDTQVNVTKTPRKCRICGKEFIPRSNRQAVCDEKHTGPCPVCGKPAPLYSLEDGPCTCSYECRMKIVQNKVKQLYGSYGNESIQNRKKQTNLSRYGNEIYQRTDDYKRKTIDTNRKRYGVDWALQSSQVKAKSKETFNKKYGGHPVHTGHSIKTRRENYINLYGVSHPSQLISSKDHYKKVCEDRYGVPSTLLLDSSISKQKWRISSNNKHFMNLLNERNIEGVFEFLIAGSRYDIGVPSIKTVFEINPSYTHNSYKTIRGHEGLSPSYHLERTLKVESEGYRCVHIWDWDDYEKVANIFRQDKNIIYARKCDLVSIDQKRANKFLSQFHLQGPAKGQDICYALVYDYEIVSVMTFGKPRFNKNFEWELIRLCYDPSFRIIGGSERLFSAFVQDNNPECIVSYCDRSKFSGDVYSRLGMNLIDEGIPTVHWYSNNISEKSQHITNNTLLRLGFDNLFGTSFGKGSSNEALMIERGYLPVYDCGQMRFEWRKRSVL